VTELGRVGLAHDHSTSVLEPLHIQCRLVGHEVLKRQRPEGVADTGTEVEEVLDGHRDAVQGTKSPAPGGGFVATACRF